MCAFYAFLQKLYLQWQNLVILAGTTTGGAFLYNDALNMPLNCQRKRNMLGALRSQMHHVAVL